MHEGERVEKVLIACDIRLSLASGIALVKKLQRLRFLLKMPDRTVCTAKAVAARGHKLPGGAKLHLSRSR